MILPIESKFSYEEIVALKSKRSGRHTFVVRICDNCKQEDIAYKQIIIRARKRRGKNLDLCKKCSNKSPFRKNKRGKESSSWRGGRRTWNGVTRIYTGYGEWIYEHRLIMEQHLGRKLLSNEIIHHIDCDSTNNNINNLHLCDSKETHRAIHVSMSKVGFSLLNQNIWFNRDLQSYVLELCAKAQYDFKVSDIIASSIWKIRRNRDNKYSEYYVEWFHDPISKTKKSVHIAVVEYLIGRKLFSDECAHHIDGDSLNNVPENLMVMTRSEHTKAHLSMNKCVGDLVKMGVVGFKDGIYFVERKDNDEGSKKAG